MLFSYSFPCSIFSAHRPYTIAWESIRILHSYADEFVQALNVVSYSGLLSSLLMCFDVCSPAMAIIFWLCYYSVRSVAGPFLGLQVHTQYIFAASSATLSNFPSDARQRPGDELSLHNRVSFRPIQSPPALCHEQVAYTSPIFTVLHHPLCFLILRIFQ